MEFEENRLADLVNEMELPDENEADTYGEAQRFLDEYKERSNKDSNHSFEKEDDEDQVTKTYMTYDGKKMDSIEDAKLYNELLEKNK